MRLRNLARMMQPPRQMVARSPRRDAPVVFGAAGLDLVEALGVGDDLRRVQRLLDIRGELFGIARSLAESAGCQTGGGLALHDRTRQRAGEHRLGDARHRDAEIECRLHRPPSGALLLGLVEDDVDERLAGLGVDLAQHLGGDLDQVAVQVALVPLGEHVGDLRRGQPEPVAQQLVGLIDQLDVGIFDAVVHHLHEVSGTIRTDMGAAGHAVDVRGDLLEQRAQRLVRLGRTAGHDRRAR